MGELIAQPLSVFTPPCLFEQMLSGHSEQRKNPIVWDPCTGRGVLRIPDAQVRTCTIGIPVRRVRSTGRAVGKHRWSRGIFVIELDGHLSRFITGHVHCGPVDADMAACPTTPCVREIWIGAACLGFDPAPSRRILQPGQRSFRGSERQSILLVAPVS